MTHEEVQELLAGYALNALDPAEIPGLEAHLSGCAVCQRELAMLREVASVLAEGVASVEPPAALRSRILAAVRPARGPRAVHPWAFGLAAVAAVLLVALAGVGVTLNHRLAVLSERLASQERILVLLANPTARTVSLTGSVQARVRLFYEPERKSGALIVVDLDDPGRDFVYQVWLIAGQEPESAGVFRSTLGQPMIVPIAADFARYQIIAITRERGPIGVQRPTTQPILAGTL